MRTKLSVVATLLLALIITSAKSAEAGVLYGSEFFGDLYEIDDTNGSHATIGSTGQSSPGLAYNGITGIMYSNSYTGLYTLDLTNAASTLVGSFSENLAGLTFSSDFSTLYAISSTGGLHSIDPLNGTNTLVGALGVGPADVLDLATDSSGTIYMMGTDDNLYTVNTSTGFATNLGIVTGLPNTAGVTAISFDENDNLFGVTTQNDNLVMIDTANLTFTTVGGNIGVDVRGLAFALDANAAVPEPATYVTFSAYFLCLAVVGWQRKRRMSVTAC